MSDQDTVNKAALERELRAIADEAIEDLPYAYRTSYLSLKYLQSDTYEAGLVEAVERIAERFGIDLNVAEMLRQ